MDRLDFYIPNSKETLIALISPEWTGPVNRLRVMDKKQLRAIFIRQRKQKQGGKT